MPRPLICVLNKCLNVDDMSVSFPMFEWFAADEKLLYTTLNEKARIPNMFIEGPFKKERALPKFIQGRFFLIQDLVDFENRRMHFQDLLANMNPIVHYCVTTEVTTMRKLDSCAFYISPNRFLEMHMHDRIFDAIPHFYFDFSSDDPAIRRFFSIYRETLGDFHALRDVYHDISFRQIDTERFIQICRREKRRFFPFSFSVPSFQTLIQKKNHMHIAISLFFLFLGP